MDLDWEYGKHGEGGGGGVGDTGGEGGEEQQTIATVLEQTARGGGRVCDEVTNASGEEGAITTVEVESGGRDDDTGGVGSTVEDP